MIPKGKAEQLVNNMMDTLYDDGGLSFKKYLHGRAKQCALIAVDVIIPIIEGYEEALDSSQQSDYLEYWQEVKQEIEKL